jgi:hypothetical protein
MDIPGAMTEAEWLAFMAEAFPTLMEALEASGACWARTDVGWRAIQPDLSAPYVWAPYDRQLGLLAETGVQLIATVGGVPDWAGPSRLGPIYADRLDEFAQFLIDLVSRYKQPPYNVNTWELFNEPDQTFSDPAAGWGDRGDQYAAMLAVAYPAIKAADSTATVLMGGIAYDWFIPHGPFYRLFPDELMESAGGGYLDALNFHYFPDFHEEWERWVPDGIPPTCGDVEDGEGTPYAAFGIDVIAKANHLRNRMKTCHGVDLPVWLTELGAHGIPDQPETLPQQARYVIQGSVRALAASVERVVYYTLVSPPNQDSDQSLLYNHDWSPKPAFYAYQTLTYELAGYEYVRTLEVDGVEGYVFRDSALREQTVAWSWGEPHESGTVTFAPASQLRVMDSYGYITYVQDGGPQDADGSEDGSIMLELPPVPVDPDPADHIDFTAEPLIVSVSIW